MTRDFNSFVTSAEAAQDSKKRRVNEVTADHLARFIEWLREYSAEGTLEATLHIPEDARAAFIPSRVYELAHDVDAVGFAVSKQKDEEEGRVETLRLLVVEKNVAVPLSDPVAWEEWRRARDAAPKGRFRRIPPPPPKVDRLHAEYREMIEEGVFSLEDRVLFEVNLRFNKAAPQCIYVSHFDGETGSGIGKEFYLDTLPRMAKALGFRFITGMNNAKNIGFFTHRLKRKTALEIKQHEITTFFPNFNPGDEEHLTVQFLYEEDVPIYSKESIG